MEMYTGLDLVVILKENIDPNVINILEYMVSKEDKMSYTPYNIKIPDHPLFDTDRWWWMCNGTSEYLKEDYSPRSGLDRDLLYIRFNIKNYTNEIKHFLDFISPYVKEILRGKWRYKEMEQDEPVRFNFKGKLLLQMEDNFPGCA